MNGAAFQDLNGILNGLAKSANDLSAGQGWRAKTRALGHEYEDASSRAEKNHLLIKMMQCQRDAGVLPADAFLANFSMLVESLADEDRDRINADPRLAAISAEIDAIERAAGLADDQFWLHEDGPPEWQALQDQCTRRRHELEAELMREYGEHEIADLYLNDQEEFDRRYDIGREYFLTRKQIVEVRALNKAIKDGADADAPAKVAEQFLEEDEEEVEV